MAYKYPRYSDLCLGKVTLGPRFFSRFSARYEMINGGPPFVVRVKDDYLIRRDVVSHIILRSEVIEVEVIRGRAEKARKWWRKLPVTLKVRDVI